MSDPRRLAREAALQALYFWEVGGTSPEAAIEAVLALHHPEASGQTIALARDLVSGTVAEVAGLDGVITRHSEHWRVERIAVVDRLILRMAIWELGHPDRTPRSVVLNEAVELARRFSSEDAVKFVNGVLDAVRRTLEAADSPAGNDDPNRHVQ